MIEPWGLHLLADRTLADLPDRRAAGAHRYGAVASAVLHTAMQFPIAGLHGLHWCIGVTPRGITLSACPPTYNGLRPSSRTSCICRLDTVKASGLEA